jgi:hypothetical protein
MYSEVLATQIGVAEMKRSLPYLVLALTLLACQSNIGSLQRAAAMSMNPTPLPDSVRVTEVHRGASSVKWVATHPNGDVYDCSADDMVRRPICVKRSK